MELLKECPFEFVESKKIGHMRCDFDGGQNIYPFRKWFGTEDWKEKIDDDGIQSMDDTVFFICNQAIDSYDKLLEYVGEYNNPYDGVDYYLSHHKFDVWLRLIPARDDYNMYINFYHK